MCCSIQADISGHQLIMPALTEELANTFSDAPLKIGSRRSTCIADSGLAREAYRLIRDWKYEVRNNGLPNKHARQLELAPA